MKEILIIGVSAALLAVSPGGQRSVKLMAHETKKTAKKIVTGKPATPGFLPPVLEPFRVLIERSSVANSIPFHIAAALIMTESSGKQNARATNPVPAWINGNVKLDGARKAGWTDGELSSAHGLAQVLGATAWDFGYRGSVAGLYVPATNLEFGMRVLHRYSKFRIGTDQLDSWRYPLIAYNGGPGAVTSKPQAAVLYAAKILDLAERYLDNTTRGEQA
jgi:soluble lytic murein transglycosylase-like protein